MALTWSVEKVADWKTVCEIEAVEDDNWNGVKKGDTLWNPVTTALVWHSLNTGIGDITEENAGEVFARISLCEKLYGASLRNQDGDVPITREDVQRHIGLHTNASYKVETRASFLKRHAGRYLDDEVVAWNRAKERELAEVAGS